GRALSGRYTSKPGVNIVIDPSIEVVKNAHVAAGGPGVNHVARLQDPDLINSFEDEGYEGYETPVALYLFRVFGNLDYMMGPDEGTFFTPTEYTNSQQAIRELALDQDRPHPNNAQYIVFVVIPKGTTVYRGNVAAIPGKGKRFP